MPCNMVARVCEERHKAEFWAISLRANRDRANCLGNMEALIRGLRERELAPDMMMLTRCAESLEDTNVCCVRK